MGYENIGKKEEGYASNVVERVLELAETAPERGHTPEEYLKVLNHIPDKYRASDRVLELAEHKKNSGGALENYYKALHYLLPRRAANELWDLSGLGEPNSIQHSKNGG